MMAASAEPKLVLDLNLWRGSQEIRVLAGREVGEDVRRKANVEALDDRDEPVEVRVPADLFSLTSSFFLGLFAPSIRKLGASQFRKHYFFTGKQVNRVVEDAIRSVILTEPFR
jgi:hypothetical protein